MHYRPFKAILCLFLLSFVYQGCQKAERPDPFEVHKPRITGIIEPKILRDLEFEPTLRLEGVQRQMLLAMEDEELRFYLEYYEAKADQAISAPKADHPLSYPGWTSLGPSAKTLCQEAKAEDVEFGECFLIYQQENFYLFGSLQKHRELPTSFADLLPSLLTNSQ